MSAAPDFWVLPRSFSIQALQTRFDLEDTPFASIRQRAKWQAIVHDTTQLSAMVRDAVHRGYGLVIVVLPEANDPQRNEYLRAYSDMPRDFSRSNVYSYDLATRADTIAIDFRGPDENVSSIFLRDDHNRNVVPINPEFFNGEKALETEYRVAFLQYWDERMHLLEDEIDDVDEVEVEVRLPLWDKQWAGFEAIRAGAHAIVDWIRPENLGLAGASSDGFGVAHTSSGSRSVVSCIVPGVGTLGAFWNELGERVEFTLRPDANQAQVDFSEIYEFSLWFDAVADDVSPPRFEVKFEQATDPFDRSSPSEFRGNYETSFRVGDLQEWLAGYRVIAAPPRGA